METKYFTLNQANALIPLINQEIIKLQALKKDFTEKVMTLKKMKALQASLESSLDTDLFFTLEAEIEFIQIEAKNHIKMLTRNGVQLKDIDLGLVDFPSMIQGEIVMLCWKQGEEKIHYYHTLEGGFAARKPIQDSLNEL
jgi:hypothetical protein